MARGYQKRYQEYRGRRRRGSLVLKVVIALLVLALLAGIVFVVVLNGGVEYTDEGVRLVFPWSQGETAGEKDTPQPSRPVIVIEDEPEPSPTQPEPEAELSGIGAVEVTPAQLLDGTAAQLVRDGGGTALVVTVKNAYGRLAWQSEQALAERLGVNGSAEFAEAVAGLKAEEELWLVARVTCFRDQALAGAGVGGPLMTRGGNVWYDRFGLRWVSPVSEDVSAYLTGLCTELAEMGFDEILLDCAGYPDLGETHVLAENELRPQERTAPVTAFLARVREALEERGAVLSVLTSEGALLGTDEYSGMTAGALAQYAHRVWAELTETGEADCAAALEQAGMEHVAQRLVRIGGRREEGSWAALSHS